MTTPPSLARAPWLNDPALRRVFKAIEAEGGEARVAGGAVRNALLGEPVSEIDLATTLTPERIMAAGKAAHLGVHPTGIEHGTVTLVADHKPYEVTSLRLDVETFGRKARVAFTDDWEADARRRDFTMNALYCSPDGNIHDLVNGYPDLLRKRIRFVGEPQARIKEDHLRILRFFRFHARYGAGAPDAKGLAACVRHRAKLRGLSGERIRQELFKLLVAGRAAETIRLMARRGVLKVILPHQNDFRALGRMAKIDSHHGFEPDALLRLALIARNAGALRDQLKLTNVEMRRLDAIDKHPAPQPKLRDHERRAALYRMGAEAWRDAVRLAWAESKDTPASLAWRDLLALPERWPIPLFPATGKDLIALGIDPGPRLGRLINRLEDWWVARDFKPSKDEILRQVKNP